MNLQTNNSKHNFRKLSLNKLREIKSYSKIKKDLSVIFKLQKLIDNLKPKTILLYLPLSIEVDVKRLILKLRKKKVILVPFMEGVSFKMVKYRLPLSVKKFNIQEPPNSNLKIKQLDLAIVPVVGVDGSLRRVGFGKGMYDRFFENLDKKTTIIFIQREMCFTKDIITNSYDIQADFYVTPKKIITRDVVNGVKLRNRRCHSNSWSSSWLCSCKKTR